MNINGEPGSEIPQQPSNAPGAPISIETLAGKSGGLKRLDKEASDVEKGERNPESDETRSEEARAGEALDNTEERVGSTAALEGFAAGTEPSPKDFTGESESSPSERDSREGHLEGQYTFVPPTEEIPNGPSASGTPAEQPEPVESFPSASSDPDSPETPQQEPPPAPVDASIPTEESSSGATSSNDGTPPPQNSLEGSEPPTNTDGSTTPENDPGAMRVGSPPPELGTQIRSPENASLEPAPSGEHGDREPTPTTPRKEEEVKAELKGKVAALAEKVQKMLDDPNGDPAFKAAYKLVRDQLVTPDVQQAANEMSNGLSDRIDTARKNEQLTLAHVLEDRQGRISEMTEQAHRQASLELLNNPQFGDQLRQELAGVDGATPELMQHAVLGAHAEADARRVLATEELQAEKGRAKNLEDIAKEIDDITKKGQSNRAKVRREELSIVKGLIKQEALQTLIDGLNSSDDSVKATARNRLELLRTLAHEAGHPLSKHDMLSKADSLDMLKDTVKKEGIYLQEKRSLYNNLNNMKSLMESATNADSAAKDGFSDANKVFSAKLQRDMTRLDLEAQRAAGKISEEEYQALINKLTNEDTLSEESEEKAKRQMKQKFRQYARNLGHSYREWRNAKTPEDKQKALQELKLSAKAFLKESAKSFLKNYLFFNLAFLFAVVAIEMRIAAKMFGQDGK